MVTTLNLTLSDEQYQRMVKQKKGRTWVEVLEDGAEVDPKELEEFNDGA